MLLKFTSIFFSNEKYIKLAVHYELENTRAFLYWSLENRYRKKHSIAIIASSVYLSWSKSPRHTLPWCQIGA